MFEGWLVLLRETVEREAYYNIYIAAVAVWFAYLGVRGLASKETRGFGWRRGLARGREAVVAGQIWVSLAVVLAALALAIKVT